MISSLLFFSACNKNYVKLTDENASYGDLDGHLKIETSMATYYFRKAGGGFSGIIDTDGNDWIGHSRAPKSSGMWRGIPNTNVPGWRPEESGTETEIIFKEDDKLVISCNKGGKYKSTWAFFPDHATMTIIKADSNYYFSYEGAPNGKFDTTTNYFYRPDAGVRHFLGRAAEESDIAAEASENYEWCYFGDTKTNRSFIFIHHQDDALADYYRPLENMTVFGFGRTGAADENLTAVPQKFTIGFLSDTAYQVVAKHVREIVDGGG